MGVGIVGLAHKHHRWLVPLREGLGSDIASSWGETDIFLAAEQDREVIMEPAAAVPAGVDHHCVAVAVFAEQPVVDGIETRSVHSAHMHVADSAPGD